jgi:choline dehydrogenase-like flavoprotein
VRSGDPGGTAFAAANLPPMNAKSLSAARRATLHTVIDSFAPPDARSERVTQLAAEAIESLSPQRRAELELLLTLLALPMKLPPPQRARLLAWLADAPAVKLRSGFAALKRLTLFLSYAESEPGSENPTWARLGYPGPRRDRTVLERLPPLSSASEGETVEADVVVIGSGAGGGVAAAVFARAGKRVVVLEAGAAYAAQDFSQRELSIADLYLERGLAATKDVGVSILAGATLGGGTTVNWCTSFRLPQRIADEWGAQSGIPELGTELAPHYAAIEDELGIAPAPVHNANNAVIVDGAQALGLHAGAMPRNAAECGDGCGYCGFGCAYAKKRSTLRAYLPDVVARGGAIYAGARVERILLDQKRAAGVVALQTNGVGEARRFRVRAGIVICAAGALRTPGLLARSGIMHRLLGRRLFLHPVAGSMATFERPIEAWRGAMQTAFSDAYNYRDGNYGAKIEVAPTHPGLGALAIPWQSAATHAQAMDRTRSAATLIALTRDRDPGSISLDDEATIRYALSPFDAGHLLAGLVGLFDIAFAAGAVRAQTLHNRPIVIERAAWNAAKRAELEAAVRRIGVAPNRQILFSAHQMGTAPMSALAASGVVDPSGRVWGYDNLYVADTSAFPQSSGVNPMLTVMAMARRVATAAAGATLEVAHGTS